MTDRALNFAIYGGGALLTALFLGLSLFHDNVVGWLFSQPAFVGAFGIVFLGTAISALARWRLDAPDDTPIPSWLKILTGVKFAALLAVLGLLILAIAFSVFGSAHSASIWRALITLVLAFALVSMAGSLVINIWVIRLHRLAKH